MTSMGNQLPAEPMTPAAEAFAAMRELYLGLRAAEFTLVEAAAIIGATIMHGANGASETTEG